ncbi:MAG: DUF1501 domain-containing protein [Planctomycetales bacterium]|nr:DUF1501 domain-containing protein [Planctomycetales bacterium]
MLTVLGQPDSQQFCDGLSRRNFLKIGALGLGAMSLPQLLAAEAHAGITKSKKSVIMIYLVGGPPHQDLFDLKPEAPSDIAGPWRPIATNLPGFEIGELLPRMAQMMDKFTVIRSLVGAQAEHDATQCYTGRPPRGLVPAGGWPQFGSVVSKLQGASHVAVPPFVSLCYTCTHGPYNEPGAGFLGMAQTPLRPLGGTRDDMVLNGVTLERLGNRHQLLTSVDRFRREADRTGAMDGLDVFTEQAMGLLTSSRLAEALDLSKEDPRTVARYGTGNPTIMMDGNGAPRVPQSLLMARRLIEAGVRVVTLNYSKWDWHGGRNAEGRANNSIFVREQEDFPIFDQAMTALVEDLHARGLAEDTAVVVWGEFGRTPIISKQVGRDHWPRVACALLAGGGMTMGQAIGSTDRFAGEATSRPVTFPEVFATLYHHLGIDPASTITDLHGRPQYLVDTNVKPIRELVV